MGGYKQEKEQGGCVYYMFGYAEKIYLKVTFRCHYNKLNGQNPSSSFFVWDFSLNMNFQCVGSSKNVNLEICVLI